ncbi:hypothetical protein [Thermus sp.]|uniref:hypothetical protein n=1 Tax=Thermus sp. TaxID=275 RepID=UPI0025FEA515|nr:hypothetical protein [Thermus sp.]MCS6867805.1 hypothetical protein [Thermus sp.]MDW8358684.1 hypothetical protein [Thermus sp.]
MGEIQRRGFEVLEKVVVEGDLARLTPQERVLYYRQVCESLGLNPLTRPFDYIVLNGRLTLYLRRDGADQLRRMHGVSVQITAREWLQDLGLYVVTARGTAPDGRTDEAIGVVSVQGLKGEALANALMKAETKAKRRATLSLVGLGLLDETEVESIPEARRVSVDLETGEVQEPSPPPKPLPSAGVTGAQIRAIGEAVRELGLEAPTARELASRLVEREVGSVKELTAEEAGELLDYLEDLKAPLLDFPPEERGRRLSAWLGAHERGVPRGEALLEPLEGSEVFLEGET